MSYYCQKVLLFSQKLPENFTTEPLQNPAVRPASVQEVWPNNTFVHSRDIHKWLYNLFYICVFEKQQLTKTGAVLTLQKSIHARFARSVVRLNNGSLNLLYP